MGRSRVARYLPARRGEWARAAKNEVVGRLSVNEQVLKHIRVAYMEDGTGLTESAQFLRDALHKELKTTSSKNVREQIQTDIDQLKKVAAPPDRITVMMVGNHSAGKSSLINWYCGEQIQNCSEAVETTGVTIIRRGKERTTWKGDITLQAYQHLREMADIPGFKENLRCEISCSNEKQFPLIDFIDTPGLTDGSVAYPFDVDKAIVALAEHAHIILIFLDPFKQALCRRTMNVVRELGEKYAEKLRFFLARADSLKSESERSDIITQCTQELTKNLHVTHGFKLHPIYLPSFKTATSGPNRIEELCVEIQKEIESRIQDALNKWKRDCALLNEIIDRSESRNKAKSAQNVSAWVWRMLLLALFAVVFAAGGLATLIHLKKIDCTPFPEVCQLTRSTSRETLGGLFAVVLIVLAVLMIVKTKTVTTLPGSMKKRCKAINEITVAQVAKQEESVKIFMQQSTF